MPPEPPRRAVLRLLPSGTRTRAAVDATVVLLRHVLLAGVVGLLAGASSALFLELLDRATRTRLDHPWLLWLLPLGGLVIGLAYHRVGGRAVEGNRLILREIHTPADWVPRRMAPMILAGTVLTHLVGGSAGREGTALQISGSLTDTLCRHAHIGRWRVSPEDRRTLLVAALAGGFGAVFGVPLAGTVFALEVRTVGWLRYDALVPALTASLVGDRVVRGLGVEHALEPRLVDVAVSAATVGKVLVAGIAFGLAGVLFVWMLEAVRALSRRIVPWTPGRPVLGAVVVLLMTAAVGTRDYLGLSLPLVASSVAGHDPGLHVSLLKLVFTAVTLGSGFVGGEVTPLFVIGATLGAALAPLLHVPVPVLAAIGFVAVFAGAAKAPLACTVMGVELFGSGALVLMAVACVTSYVCSWHRGIYHVPVAAVAPTGPGGATGPSDPGPSDPGPSDPGPSDPGPSDPGRGTGPASPPGP